MDKMRSAKIHNLDGIGWSIGQPSHSIGRGGVGKAVDKVPEVPKYIRLLFAGLTIPLDYGSSSTYTINIRLWPIRAVTESGLFIIVWRSINVGGYEYARNKRVLCCNHNMRQP